MHRSEEEALTSGRHPNLFVFASDSRSNSSLALKGIGFQNTRMEASLAATSLGERMSGAWWQASYLQTHAAACTPLSVRDAVLHLTFFRSPALESLIAPASTRCRGNRVRVGGQVGMIWDLGFGGLVICKCMRRCLVWNEA